MRKESKVEAVVRSEGTSETFAPYQAQIGTDSPEQKITTTLRRGLNAGAKSKISMKG